MVSISKNENGSAKAEPSISETCLSPTRLLGRQLIVFVALGRDHRRDDLLQIDAVRSRSPRRR